METIIDALAITLGLDPSDYEKGAKRTATAHKKVTESVVKGTKEIAAESKGAAQAISQLRSDAIALLAVFLGGRGFKDFVQDIGFGDAAMARMAKTTRMSTQELSAWKGMADMAGGSGDDLLGTLQGLSDQYNQWQLTGESSIAPALRALQTINPNLRLDQNGQMADLGQFLLQLSDTVKNMPAPRARSLLQMLGIDSNTINVILQGRAAMEGYLKASKALQGPVEESAVAGKELQAAWAQTDLAMRGAGRTLLVEIAPALIEVLHLVRDFALWAQQHPKLIAGAFWLVTAAVTALSVALTVNLARMALVQTAAGFGVAIGLIRTLLLWMSILTVDALPALSAAFYAMDTALAANPIGLIVIGLAAIAAAAYLIYDNWGTIKGWWHDLWASMGLDVSKVNAILRQAAELALLALPGGSGLAFQMMAEDAQGGAAAAPGGAASAGAGPIQRAAPDVSALLGGSGGSGGAPTGPYSEDSVQSFLRGALPGVRITGGARTPERNRAVGGVANSMHLNGQAVDFVLPAGTSFGQFKAMLNASGFQYTELLNEGQIGGQGAHVHLGWRPKRLAAIPRAYHAVQSRGGNVNNSRVVHNDTRIGSMPIHTSATDGPGIARDIHAEISTHGLAVQANSGLA